MAFLLGRLAVGAQHTVENERERFDTSRRGASFGSRRKPGSSPHRLLRQFPELLPQAPAL